MPIEKVAAELEEIAIEVIAAVFLLIPTFLPVNPDPFFLVLNELNICLSIIIKLNKKIQQI